ncbi:MAG TPA: osmotically inducible protein OsmC [Chitinophagaceae bacterium]|nr:osmotically inducible protein OsmC [Chitinophagaceae bacterium]HCT23172.1 osmotically inducible protein OsmC [Chitinophagaceae bacterium]
MEPVHFYDTTIEWQDSRRGALSSSVLESNIEVVTPPEFAGGIPGKWSPEHLLVAAVNSCLMTTFLAIAENSKLEFIAFKSYANGKLEKVDGKFMISEITLSPTLVLPEGANMERAERILQKSEAACLISNSVKATIIFQPHIVAEETAGIL